MSILVNGVLSVQRINGSNGEFCVGKLECELGPLNIKDPHLDQYKNGKYEGRFGVERIFANGYMTRTGAFIVEIRAIINEYIIFTDEPENIDPDDVALKDTDPLESSESESIATEAVESPQSKPKPTQTTKSAPTETEGVDLDYAELFGELWPLGDKVQLDPTTIRSEPQKHRKRVDYLSKHGYEFKASTQNWEKATANLATTLL